MNSLDPYHVSLYPLFFKSIFDRQVSPRELDFWRYYRKTKTVCHSFGTWNCELEGWGQNQCQASKCCTDTAWSQPWRTQTKAPSSVCNTQSITRPDLHDEIPGEPDQGQQGVLEGGCQGQALAAEGAQVGGLHGADVAFCRDGVVGKGVALGRTHTHQSPGSGTEPHTAPSPSNACCCIHTTSGPEAGLTHEPMLGNSLVWMLFQDSHRVCTADGKFWTRVGPAVTQNNQALNKFIGLQVKIIPYL